MGRDVKVRFIGQDEVTGTLKKIEGGVKGFADAMKTALAGLGVALSAAALGNFFKSAIEGAANADRANRQLANSLQNVGGKYEARKPAIDATVASVQKFSTFDDDSLTSALTTLITTSGNAAASLQNLQLTADLAAARQMDLRSAAELVGKVMAGQTDSLSRFGIVIAKGADAIQVLRERYAGFAREDAQSLQGTLARLKNNWDDFAKAVGRAITNGDAAGGTLGALVDKLKELEGWVTANEQQLQAFTAGLASIVTGAGSVVAWIAGKLVLAFQGGQVAIAGVITAAESLAPRFKIALGTVSEELSAWLEGMQGVLSRFGIQLGDGLVKSMADAGARMKLEGLRGLKELRDTLEITTERIFGYDRRTAGYGGASAPGGVAPGGPGTPIDNLGLEAGTNQRGNLGLTTFGRPGGEPGQSPSGIPDILQGQGGGISAAADQTEHLTSSLHDALAAMGVFRSELKGTDNALANIAAHGLVAVADGFADVVANFAAGKEGFGGLVQAVRQTVAEVAKSEGKLAIRKGAVKVAEGLFPPNPAMITSGLAMIAKGTALSALGGAAGGGEGYSGGGAGGGRGRDGGYDPSGTFHPSKWLDDQRRMGDAQQLEVRISAPRGALLDVGSPSGQRLLAKAFQAARSARVLELDLENA